jgi:predicted MFS family arabinose efflux permease
MNAERSWLRELSVLVAGLFFAFVNVTLLVPVLPVLAEKSGGSAAAGLVTAIFYLPTVATQLRMPLLMQRHSARRLLALSFALLSLPCFVYAAAPESLAALLGATAVRGVGFGIVTVLLGTLVAQLAPPGRRGTAVGYAGLVSGIPPVFAPALGVVLLHDAGPRWVLAGAGVVGAAGSLAAVGLSEATRSWRERPTGLLRAMLQPILLWPLVWFGLVCLTRGAVVSFVPLTLLSGGLASAASFLLFFGTFGYVARWVWGRLADAFAVRGLVVAGSLLAIAGLVLLAADDGAAAVALSGALYGAGSGALMSASQLDFLSRGSRTGFAVPTAVWNIAIDCGFGLGGVLLGVAAAAAGYDAAFWILPPVMVVALLLVIAEPRGAGGAESRQLREEPGAP